MPPRRRAERFEMELPVWYQLSNSDRWEEATTVNVSHNGVLARASAENMVPSGDVDFVVSLPPCGVVPLARIRCSGRLVRVSGTHDATAFALSIDRYRFVKPGEGAETGEGATR